jgi:hypothetical protein
MVLRNVDWLRLRMHYIPEASILFITTSEMVKACRSHRIRKVRSFGWKPIQTGDLGTDRGIALRLMSGFMWL